MPVRFQSVLPDHAVPDAAPAPAGAAALDRWTGWQLVAAWAGAWIAGVLVMALIGLVAWRLWFRLTLGWSAL